MDNSIHTEHYKDYTIKFYQDEYAESPREWDNFGHMICFHKRYSLGDKHDFTPQSFLQYLKENHYSTISLPLYLYDHSGLRLSIRDFKSFDPQEWDSGQIGFIYATKEEIIKEFGSSDDKNVKKALELLYSEVSTYDKFLSGAVYGYVITDKEGDDLDSCWGFFDDISYILKEYCIPAIESDILSNLKEKLQLQAQEIGC